MLFMTDFIAEAYYKLACRLFMVVRAGARRGNVEDRLWLMSSDGASFMESLGLDASAVQARLVAEWCQASRKRRTIDKVSESGIVKV